MTLIRGGVFTRADARACGYPDPDIDSLLDLGGWRRIRPGTYAAHRALALVTEEMLYLRRIYHVLRYGGPGLAASHQSAAALHALPLWGLDLGQVHVTTRDGRPGRHAGGVHRHVRDPVGPGIQLWNKLRLVSPARAVAEVAAGSELAPGVVLAEAALYSGLVTPTSLKRAANQLIQGVERAQRAFSKAGVESASVAESRLRLILGEAGLPVPSSSPPPGCEVEVEVTNCALWFPDERTVVEFEPHEPFWCEEVDDCPDEAAARIFGAPSPGEPAVPEPLEYCWISWSDLDDPALVVDRVRTAFARASRRTGVRVFDPDRRRRKRLDGWAGRRGAGAGSAFSSDHDLPC
jgi:hypothetical protein